MTNHIQRVLARHRLQVPTGLDVGFCGGPYCTTGLVSVEEHEAHVASAFAPLLADLLAQARADVLREHADREMAHEGATMAVERILAHAHEHDGHLVIRPATSPEEGR